VVVEVELPGRTIYAKVYRIQVGRIPLFLMDTDIHPNSPQDRELSAARQRRARADRHP
jgi:starch phosphorylase